MMSRLRLFTAIPLVASALAIGPTYGQGAPVTHTRPGLTAKQIAKAKPYRNKLPAPDTSRLKARPAPANAPAPVLIQGSNAEPTTTGTRAFGSFGIPYTSTRVALGPTTRPYGTNIPNFLHTTFPYRAIGKVTFTAPDGGEYHCSATVIRRSLIVTAAHCIQDFGAGGVVNRNFEFTPGAYFTQSSSAAQDAPYGIWKGRHFVRPVTWANGTDKGDGSAVDNDVAVIILDKKNGATISQQTGIIGYAANNYGFTQSPKTGNLQVAATSTLGYPALLDGGNIMQRADGPTYPIRLGEGDPTVPEGQRSWQLWQGSDFTEGSSGGPWIVNFGAQSPVRSGGAVAGMASKMAVVGVTSWGSASPNGPKDNYSSQFRQNSAYPNANYGIYGAGNIGALISEACSARPVAGGQTYAQLGYC